MSSVEKTWSSKQYKRAAETHYKVCNYNMIANIDTVKAIDKPKVYFEVFYISGYIIECILKYGILQALHQTENLTKKDLENCSVWTHDINNLWTRACAKINMPMNRFTWNDLTKKWDHQIRYESDNQDFKDSQKVLRHYNETVVPIFNNLKNKY